MKAGPPRLVCWTTGPSARPPMPTASPLSSVVCLLKNLIDFFFMFNFLFGFTAWYVES